MKEPSLVFSISNWGDVLSKLFPISGVLFLIITFFYIRIRTGSNFFLIYRIHELLGGMKPFYSKRLSSHWESFEDLNRVNLWFGLKLKSSSSLNEFLNWIERGNIEIHEAGYAVPYLNATKRKFFLPRFRRLTHFIISFFISMLTVVIITFAINPMVLVSVTKTHTWFWVSTGKANSLLYPLSTVPGIEGWAIDSEFCLFNNKAYPLEDEWDKTVICNLVLGTFDKHLKSTIKLQHATSIYFSFIALYILIAYVPLRIRGTNAIALHRRMRWML
jgi:hypothetical protein